jgi:signal transduction histidine kinase
MRGPSAAAPVPLGEVDGDGGSSPAHLSRREARVEGSAAAPRSDRGEFFAACVAHELRTPLATQRALLELALADQNATKPSNGLEPLTPSVPWIFVRNCWQPVATELPYLRGISALRIAEPLPPVALAGLHQSSIRSPPKRVPKQAIQVELRRPGIIVGAPWMG